MKLDAVQFTDDVRPLGTNRTTFSPKENVTDREMSITYDRRERLVRIDDKRRKVICFVPLERVAWFRVSPEEELAARGSTDGKGK